MKLLDILNARKANPSASKVYINPDDSRKLFNDLAVLPKLDYSMSGGLLWYEDATLAIGEFRLE